MKTKYILIFALLASVLAFGQQNCLPGGVPGVVPGGGEGQAKTIGIDLILSEPKDGESIREGRSFKVELDVINYGTIFTSGTIYLEDSMSDVYGGISTESILFKIDAASEEKDTIIPAREYISSPVKYSYTNIPSSQEASIFATIEYPYITDTNIKPYSDKSKICVGEKSEKCPEMESKNVNTRTPLSITRINKVSMGEENGGIGFTVEIHLKKLVDGTLSSTFGLYDNLDDNKIRVDKVEFAEKPLQCEDVVNGEFSIKNENILKCDGLVSEIGSGIGIGDNFIRHPLVVQLSYVVKIQRSVDITIEKRSQI